MIDPFSHIYATLQAADYFQDDLDGFEDSEGRFKVFLEDESPDHSQTPYVTVKILPADQDQRTDWSSPQVILTTYGTERQRTTIVAITNEMRLIFKDGTEFAPVGDADPVGYALLGPAVFSEDRDPVTELINRSVGLSFGTDE